MNRVWKRNALRMADTLSAHKFVMMKGSQAILYAQSSVLIYMVQASFMLNVLSS